MLELVANGEKTFYWQPAAKCSQVVEEKDGEQAEWVDEKRIKGRRVKGFMIMLEIIRLVAKGKKCGKSWKVKKIERKSCTVKRQMDEAEQGQTQRE